MSPFNSDSSVGSAQKFLEQLDGRRPRTGSRYRIDGEVGRGGMGAILKVWDDDLRRHLAMKVILAGDGDGAGEGSPSTDPNLLARFLEEAQVTGQLSHPGIVPVHELGVDGRGRVYFTMKLVSGRNLRSVYEMVATSKDGWTKTRALSILLRVCEALAYAHSKGVIHRDLKPDNVMVGDFGEVYVMDWGLARVMGSPDPHDVRLATSVQDMELVRTRRSEERESTPHSPLMTMAGDVVGTPAYMSPEQARGEISKLSARSDVYSVGAMLYYLLAGQAPYMQHGVRINHFETLKRVRSGPLQSLRTLAPNTAPELVSIVEKAMNREESGRYQDMQALAEDLRSFLEQRVVSAYETGAWAELKKWVLRNRTLAAALGAAVAFLIAGMVVSLAFKSKADEQALVATQKTNDVLALSAIQDLSDLEERAKTLWPPTPAMLPEFQRWIGDARDLVEGRTADPGRGIEGRASLRDHERKLAELTDAGVEDPSLGSIERRWWRAQLGQLVTKMKSFADEKTGGLYSAGISAGTGWGILRRAEFARTIEDRSISSPDARSRWDRAAAAIAKSPHYGGLLLKPQLGLLPIGADPMSGLEEFAHLQTGDAPERDAEGKLVRTDATALVFVLIPGGEFTMGAQRDSQKSNFFADAPGNEGPVHTVKLAAYFISKYEMTQAQWERATSSNPSEYDTRKRFNGKEVTRLHPVEAVSWYECERTLNWLGLALPTEAQWERAARAGKSTPWSTGSERNSLEGFANLPDKTAVRAGAAWEGLKDWPELEDGWVVHAPTGSFLPNAFGLHDVHGNVWEWCLEPLEGYEQPVDDGDGRRKEAAGPKARDTRLVRGGCFLTAASLCRSAYRAVDPPEARLNTLGVRPARRVDY